MRFGMQGETATGKLGVLLTSSRREKSILLDICASWLVALERLRNLMRAGVLPIVSS
jgi:hypothetical protein